jgi:hypothetical protein
MNSFFY